MQCAFSRDVPVRHFFAISTRPVCTMFAETRPELSSGHRVYLVIAVAGIYSSKCPKIHSWIYLLPFLPFLDLALLLPSVVPFERSFSSVNAELCERLRNQRSAGNKFIPARNNICAGRGNIPVPPTSTRGYSRIRVHMCARRTDDGTNARDSRARDNDNTAWTPRVYSPSKASAQHARALWHAFRRCTQRRWVHERVCVCVCKDVYPRVRTCQ